MRYQSSKSRLVARLAVVTLALGIAGCANPASSTPLKADTPTGLTATASSGQVALTWSAAEGAIMYHVYRSTTSGDRGTQIHTVTTTSDTDTSVVNDTTYSYQVTAADANGEFGISSQQSATPTAQWWNLSSTGMVSLGSDLRALVFDANGTPYLNASGTITGSAASVMTFDGTGWTRVGDANYSDTYEYYSSLAIDPSGHPYVAYQDATTKKACVVKSNGSSWVTVGGTGISSGEADYISLAINASGVPYVAYEDYPTIYRASVKIFDGTNWVQVGQAGFSPAEANYLSLAIFGDTPYLAFEDLGHDLKVSVMKFDGSQWVFVGSPGFSAGWSENVQLAIDASGRLFVAYDDIANGQKISVMKFDGNQWVYIGNAGFSSLAIFGPSFAVDTSGVPYVAYSDYNNPSRLVVMTYKGARWTPIGSDSLTASAYCASIATYQDRPYIAFQNGFSGSTVSYMSYH